MKEITVLTDARMSPDSPELVLVHQRICVVDGGLQLIGEPSESKVLLLYRRVLTSVKGGAEQRVLAPIVAEVKNTGLLPVEITSVMIHGQGLIGYNSEKEGVEKSDQEIPWSVPLFPEDRDQGNLLPGESREWYLPIDFVRIQLRNISVLAPHKYKLVVLSGKQPISEVPGDQLQPLFAAMEEAREPLISDALRMVLLSLPVVVRDRLDKSLKSLTETPLDRWSEVPGLEKLENSLFLLVLPPDYRVLFRRRRQGRIEVIDVARTPDRQPAAATG